MMMEQKPKVTKETDGFREDSYAVQWRTKDRPNQWKYYSNFTPDPKVAEMDRQNAVNNSCCVDVRIVKRTDERRVIAAEELQRAPGCSRKECQKLPSPNEGGRLYYR